MTNKDSTPPVALRPQTVVFTDKRELYRCYMPFISGGALFVPFNEDVTPNKVFPGQKMFILLTVLNGKKTPIQGKVCWINKAGLNKGYGVSLGDSTHMKALKELIESNITELMAKKDPTYTI